MSDIKAALVIVVRAEQDGEVIGDIYTVDFAAYAKRMVKDAVPGNFRGVFEDGSELTLGIQFPYMTAVRTMEETHGALQQIDFIPEDQHELDFVLEEVRRERAKSK